MGHEFQNVCVHRALSLRRYRARDDGPRGRTVVARFERRLERGASPACLRHHGLRRRFAGGRQRLPADPERDLHVACRPRGRRGHALRRLRRPGGSASPGDHQGGLSVLSLLNPAEAISRPRGSALPVFNSFGRRAGTCLFQSLLKDTGVCVQDGRRLRLG